MKLDKYRKYNNDGIDSENDFFFFFFEKQLEQFGGDDIDNRNSSDNIKYHD